MRPRLHRVSLPLALVLHACVVGGCSQQRPAIRNVLLISIDTLRADHVSSYGFGRDTTPHIDALAREGVLFRSAYTTVPVTLPAHASMLTGTLPPTHGLRDNLHKRLPDSSVTLAEILKTRGLATTAVVSSFVLDHRFNLSQGFDSYDDRFQEVHTISGLNERKGDETTRVAMTWLAEHGSKPFFLFLHYYDPHDPYEPPEPFASQWKDDRYAGEVAFADHCVGQVLDELRRLGLYEQTLIVITGDHGEMLGEHGELNHGFFIYEGALRVPLVFRVPGASKPAQQVDHPVSLIDIVPTVAALVGAPPPAQAQGLDLSPWLAGTGAGGGGRPLYAETVTATRYYGANSLLAVIADGWKYIETTRPELYDLRRDPGETRDLVAKEPARAADLGKRLAAIVASSGRAPAANEAAPLDNEARQRLAALGYLSRGGGDAPVFDRSKEDPKDLIAFFRSDQRLSELVEAKEYAQARSLCDQMLRQRPGFADCHLQMSKIAAAEGDTASAVSAARKAVALAPENVGSRLHLAGLLRVRGDRDAAIGQYREALERDPHSHEAMAQLGRALVEKGSLDEAVSLLGAAAASRAESPETATQLGLALARQGKLADAVVSYRRALALDPASAEAHSYLGSALASQGNLDEAIAHFELALRARPDHAALHDWMGVALREKGRTDEALRYFREALRLDPNLAIAHYNLARTLKQQGHRDEAIEHYRRAIALNPRLAAAHNGLGSILGSQGRLDDAIRHFRDALRAEPGDAEAHNNLGLALYMQGRSSEALAAFQAALRLRPDWTGPMGEVAWILATHPDERTRNPAEAVRLAKRAAEKTARRQPVILDALAAAYAAAGDFEHAAATAQEGASVAASSGAADLAADLERRLALYRQRKPFRETGRRTVPRLP